MAFLKAQGAVLVLREKHEELTGAIKILQNALASLGSALRVVSKALGKAEEKLDAFNNQTEEK